jgi:hypothetical protein
VDLTKEQYANNAIEFLQSVARKRLSSEYSGTEKPRNPMEVLNSLIMQARQLAVPEETVREEEVECDMNAD